MANLNDLLKNMPPGRKQRLVWVSCIVLVIGGATIAYRLKGKASPLFDQRNQEKEIVLDAKVLEKSLVSEAQKTARDQNIVINKLLKEVEAIKGKHINLDLKEPNTVNVPIPPNQQLTLPPPPAPLPPAGSNNKAIVFTEETFGAITVSSNPFLDDFTDPSDGNKKKGGNSIYLPPSFMEATLLTGLDAETVASASGEPEPVLLRIKDLAVLPNRIKANLKGCFVIAHGFGKLSKEAVMLRLVTLSCVAKNGHSVIDQAIKGWVAGSTSKNGVKGKVVHKMGESVAYAAIAGLFGGAGDALSSSATSTSTSPLGTTQIIDTDKIERAAIGGALSSGSKEIQKLYLELARQATPVIEMLPAQTVTVIISEGVHLEIKETCQGEERCEI